MNEWVAWFAWGMGMTAMVISFVNLRRVRRQHRMVMKALSTPNGTRALTEARQTIRRVLDAIDEDSKTVKVTGQMRLNLVSSYLMTTDALNLGKEDDHEWA